MSETQNTLKLVLDKPLQLDINLPNFQGAPGENGKDGRDGRDGDDAYRIAVRNGFSGTEKEWLATLKGESGKSIEISESMLTVVPQGYTKDITGILGYLIDKSLPQESGDDFTVYPNKLYHLENTTLRFKNVPMHAIVKLVRFDGSTPATGRIYSEKQKQYTGEEISFEVRPDLLYYPNYEITLRSVGGKVLKTIIMKSEPKEHDV